jgi:hypothetical protein
MVSMYMLRYQPITISRWNILMGMQQHDSGTHVYLAPRLRSRLLGSFAV